MEARRPLLGRLVLTMIDTDVRPNGWSPWIIVNLSPTTSELPQAVKVPPATASAVAVQHWRGGLRWTMFPGRIGRAPLSFPIGATPAEVTRIAPDAPASKVIEMLENSVLDRAALTGLATP